MVLDDLSGLVSKDGDKFIVSRWDDLIMFRSPLLRLLLSAIVTLWAVAVQAQARQLEWRSVDVTVRLDADGAPARE